MINIFGSNLLKAQFRKLLNKAQSSQMGL